MSLARVSNSRISAVHRAICTVRRLPVSAIGRCGEHAPMKSRSQGTTLMELLTAMAVIGILVAIAVPSFRSFAVDSRTTAFTNDLVTALNLARSEAIKRSSAVAVCAASNLTSCSGSADWSTGWILYEDRNSNGAFDNGEPLLRVWNAATTSMTVSAANDSSGSVNRVTYDSMGMGSLGGASFVRFSLVPNNCTGNRAGRTDVLIAGTIRSTKVACP